MASGSDSYVSNTVSSFVIASRSWIRFVRLSNFSLPPCRLTVVYVRTISPRPGAVDVGNAFEVEQQLLPILLDERVDLVLQELVAFAERHLPLQVQNRHSVDDSFVDVHRRSLQARPRRRDRPGTRRVA